MKKVELTYGDIIIDLEPSFVSIKVDGTNEEEKIETYGKCFEEKEPTGEEKEEHRKMPFKVFRYLDVNGSFKELLVFPTRDHKLFCLSCNEIKFLASNGYKPHMCDGFDVAGDFAEFTFAVNDSGQNLDLPLEIITITENGSIRKKTLKRYSKVEYSKDGGFIIAEDKEGYDFISKSGKLQMSGLNDIKFEWAIAINHEGDIENLNFISCFKKDPNYHPVYQKTI